MKLPAWRAYCMKKIFFTVILIIAISFAVTVNSAEIKGKILNSEGMPVDGATISLEQSALSCQSGSDGTFVLTIPDTTPAKIIIEHPNYFKKIINIHDNPQNIIVTLVPHIRQNEEIVVTATRFPEQELSLPAAETVVPAISLEEKSPSSIEQALNTVAGVSSIGSGGFSKVPVIRGLSRGRVLFLVDNARISSDRRTGPNASFVNPEDIESIEVLRSPSSVFYGSDAIGGVIHVMTKSAPAFSDKLTGSVKALYGFNNNEKQGSIALGKLFNKTAVYFSTNLIDADNYHAPPGEIIHSYYSSYGTMLKINHDTEARAFVFGLMVNRGIDIGKPAITSITDPTWYPRESQNLFTWSWTEKNFAKGELSLHAYANPNSLDTDKEKWSTYKEKLSSARTDSFDSGIQMTYSRLQINSLRMTMGFDWNSRIKVNAININTKYDKTGAIISQTEEKQIQDGKKNDYGVFLSM